MFTGPHRVALTSTVLVPFAAASVADARHAMAADLEGQGVPPAAVDDAVLVLSELLSNALRHARPLPSGRVRVRWCQTRNGVEVEVTDGGSTTRPCAAIASMSATGGRGLAIVAEVVHDWGVRDGANRNTVWAVVPTREPALLG